MDHSSPTPDDPRSAHGAVGFARRAGSSIAGRDAAAWVTDFLNGGEGDLEPQSLLHQLARRVAA